VEKGGGRRRPSLHPASTPLRRFNPPLQPGIEPSAGAADVVRSVASSVCGATVPQVNLREEIQWTPAC
jgi:hypothetical protein